MSPAPGVIEKDVEPTIAANPSVDVSTIFAVIQSERGPANTSVKARTQEQFEAILGGAVSFGYGHDAARLMPGEGSSDVYYSRAVGPAAKAASNKLVNAAGENCMEVTAANAKGESDPGEWGNSVKAQITVPEAGKIKVIVKLGTAILEESLALTRAEAILWAKSSPYIRLKELLASDPKAQEVTLTGGTDDRANITITQLEAAEKAHTAELGPGTIIWPGLTTKAARQAMGEAAKAKNRLALPDAVDTHTVSTLISGTAELATLDPTILRCMAKPVGPWVEVPSDAQGVTKLIPPSILVAARIAGHDAETYKPAIGVNNPNSPAAGVNGILTQALGLSQEAWTDLEREQLGNEAINVIRKLYGQVRLYDYMTLANPLTDPNHTLVGNRRIDMAIKAKAQVAGEPTVLGQIDSKGHALSDLQSAIKAVCQPYFEVGALFEDNRPGVAEPAPYSVDVGEDVNPIEQLFGEHKALAAIKLRRAPMARIVEIQFSVEGVS
jgi:hypothetical protein